MSQDRSMKSSHGQPNVIDEYIATFPPATQRILAELAATIRAAAPGAAEKISYRMPTFALHGNLGSGKTTFVQGMVRGLGIGEQVSSPTFALIHEYGYPARFFHIDCYRETSVERWIQIGLSDYFDREAISAIEWADHVAALLPQRAYHLTFLHGEGEHERVIRMRR